ncbi:MAG: hypothetical protein ACRDJM_05830 [Actinomycetota bacterium]
MGGPTIASRARAAGWGVAIVTAYLVAAAVTLGSGRLPLRPFFEGTAPPAAYRWVKPPAGLAAKNRPPEPGEGVVKLGKKGSESGNVTTNDGQALIAVAEGSFKRTAGETEVKITLKPIDAATLGPPPKGLNYDGNAYRFSAAYTKSGKPAEIGATKCPVGAQPKVCPTIVMRYAFGATGMYQRKGSSWTKVEGATPTPQGLQIFAESPVLGTFVAVGPPRAETAPPSRVGDYIAIGLGAVAIVGAVLLSRSKGIRRRWRRWRKTRAVRAARKGSPSVSRTPPKKYKNRPKTYGNAKRKR